MKRAERRELRLHKEELKVQLIDQGCKTLRDAFRRDYETCVQFGALGMRLGKTYSDEVLEIAGLKEETQRDE